MRVELCRSCRADIVWCQTKTGKRMPVDADPVADGNVEVIEQEHGGIPFARVVEAGGLFDQDRVLRKAHFATCPEADSWRHPT